MWCSISIPISLSIWLAFSSFRLTRVSLLSSRELASWSKKQYFHIRHSWIVDPPCVPRMWKFLLRDPYLVFVGTQGSLVCLWTSCNLSTTGTCLLYRYHAHWWHYANNKTIRRFQQVFTSSLKGPFLGWICRKTLYAGFGRHNPLFLWGVKKFKKIFCRGSISLEMLLVAGHQRS